MTAQMVAYKGSGFMMILVRKAPIQKKTQEHTEHMKSKMTAGLCGMGNINIPDMLLLYSDMMLSGNLLLVLLGTHMFF